MKKFQIIEEGRILNSEELRKVHGGACTAAQLLMSCTGGEGFVSGPCAMLYTCGTGTALLTCYDNKYGTCGGNKETVIFDEIGNIVP